MKDYSVHLALIQLAVDPGGVSIHAGLLMMTGGGMYCATKFAVDALTTATRHDLIASSNVRVSAISPGAVQTGLSPFSCLR